MATVVTAANLLITVMGFLLAWKLLRWRRSLAALTRWLEATEHDLARDLPQARDALYASADASRRARDQLTRLRSGWLQAQQLLMLLSLWQTVARRIKPR